MDSLSMWIPVILFFLSLAITGLTGVIVYLFKQTTANRENLMNYKLEVANTYAKDGEIKELLKRMDSKLDTIREDVHNNRSK